MISLIHHPAYDAASVADGHRFPMRKYSLVADRLRRAGRQFVTPKPATTAMLTRVHAQDYVQGILQGTLPATAARRIGFDITSAIADRSLAAVGGTCHAADLALEVGVAINLAGGSHHAHRDFGAGFCVFNDVAVAAQHLLDSGRIQQAAILDFDVHHGDGTAHIFANEARVKTVSLHCEANWPRHKPPSDLDIGLPKGAADTAYLEAAKRALSFVFAERPPDILFYNAGVDPHADDRLGLLSLTNSGLYRRDKSVAEAAFRAGIPLCAVLGGGYSHDADGVARRHLLLIEAIDAVFTA